MKRYFIIVESETRNPIGKTLDEEVALSWLMQTDEQGNRPYDYYSYDIDEKHLV